MAGRRFVMSWVGSCLGAAAAAAVEPADAA